MKEVEYSYPHNPTIGTFQNPFGQHTSYHNNLIH